MWEPHLPVTCHIPFTSELPSHGDPTSTALTPLLHIHKSQQSVKLDIWFLLAPPVPHDVSFADHGHMCSMALIG